MSICNILNRRSAVSDGINLAATARIRFMTDLSAANINCYMADTALSVEYQITGF